MATTTLELDDGHAITIRLDGNLPAISLVDRTGEVAVRITALAPLPGVPSGGGLWTAQGTEQPNYPTPGNEQGTGGTLDVDLPTQPGEVHWPGTGSEGQEPRGLGTAGEQQASFLGVLAEEDSGPRIDLRGQTGAIRLGGIVEEPKTTTATGLANPETNFTLQVPETVRKLKVRITLLGEEGRISVGGNDVDGRVALKQSDGGETIRMNAKHGDIVLGGHGVNGDLKLLRANGKETVRLNGNYGDIVLGGHGVNGDLKLLGTGGDLRIHVKGADGDIILSNADFAEDFDVAEPIEAGTVVVLDETSRLRPSCRAYDSALVGVIAGAGGCKPAIVADRQPDAVGRQAVSLLGKAWCKVEADHEPVAVGDLLTTSNVPGHAMKVGRRGDAIGALLGKALAPLPSGRALVPILVLVR